MAGSPLLGLLAGLAQIPKDVQARKDANQQRQFTQADNQAKLGADQANAQMAQTQAQTAGLALQSAKLQRAYQLADMYGQQAAADPTKQTNAPWLNNVRQQLGGLGLQVPDKPGQNGLQSIDFQAMRQRPAFDAAAMEKLAATPDMATRQGILATYDPATVPPDVLKVPFRPPITPGTEQATLQGFQKAYQGLANGDSPKKFLTYLTANYGTLKALMPSDPNKPGTGIDAFFDPAWQRDAVSSSVQAKIDYMHHLGIKIDDEEKFRNAQIGIELGRLKQGDERLDIQRGELAVRQRNADTALTQAQTSASRLQYSLQDLNFRMQNADVQNALRASATQRSSFQAKANQVATYRDQLNTQLQTLKRQYAITKGSGLMPKGDPMDPTGPLYQLDPSHTGQEPDPNDPTGLKKLPMSLAAQAAQADAAVKAAQDQLTNAGQQAMSRVIGAKAQPAEGATAIGLPTGWRTVKKNADGTFDVSNGKTTRKWRNE